MLKLYDYELSGNCFKIRWFLNILGIEYESIPVEFYPGKEHQSSSFKEINPLGQLPVIDDDDLRLRGPVRGIPEAGQPGRAADPVRHQRLQQGGRRPGGLGPACVGQQDGAGPAAGRRANASLIVMRFACAESLH